MRTDVKDYCRELAAYPADLRLKEIQSILLSRYPTERKLAMVTLIAFAAELI